MMGPLLKFWECLLDAGADPHALITSGPMIGWDTCRVGQWKLACDTTAHSHAVANLVNYDDVHRRRNEFASTVALLKSWDRRLVKI